MQDYEMQISEKQFKENLIRHLNKHNSGWIDGDDKEKGLENKKTADVVNHKLKICIEIKDDGKFSEPTTSSWSGEFEIGQMNRQLRNWLKDSSKKFENYKEYRSLTLINTNKTDWPKELLISAIYGKEDLQKKNGYEFPSSVFINKDQSTENVGGIIFHGRMRSIFFENTNSNVSRQRKIPEKWIEEIFLNTLFIDKGAIPAVL